MNQRRLVVILLLVLILMGCNRETSSATPPVTGREATPVSPDTSTSPPVLPTNMKTPTLTLVPTATATDTLTPTPWPTPTVTPTLQPLPITQVISQCISMADSPPEGFLSDGMVLFYRQNLSDEPAINNLMKITADNLEPEELAGIPSSQSFWPEAVSPNHQWLFYGTYEGGKLVLLSTIQQPPQLVWLDGKDYGFWLNNENMTRFIFNGNLQVINPFTGESNELVLGIQDFYRDRWLQDQVPWHPLLDPTQTFVVYPKAGGTGGNARLAIRDLRSGEDVWILDGYDIVLPPPAAWSPDGSKLVVASTKYSTPDRFELFMIDRNMQAELWVDISGYINGLTNGSLQWSPDGRYVIILGNAPRGRTISRKISVLDTQTRQLVDYCDVIPDYYSTLWDGRVFDKLKRARSVEL
ncbi:MAG: TolB family protein [Chloroflexota bacterium]